MHIRACLHISVTFNAAEPLVNQRIAGLGRWRTAAVLSPLCSWCVVGQGPPVTRDLPTEFLPEGVAAGEGEWGVRWPERAGSGAESRGQSVPGQSAPSSRGLEWGTAGEGDEAVRHRPLVPAHPFPCLPLISTDS